MHRVVLKRRETICTPKLLSYLNALYFNLGRKFILDDLVTWWQDALGCLLLSMKSLKRHQSSFPSDFPLTSIFHIFVHARNVLNLKTEKLQSPRCAMVDQTKVCFQLYLTTKEFTQSSYQWTRGGLKPSVYRKKAGIPGSEERGSHVLLQSSLCSTGGEESGIRSKFGEGAEVHYLEKGHIISFSMFFVLEQSFFRLHY